MKIDPYQRNENPDEIREVCVKIIQGLRENKKNPDIKSFIFELEDLKGRIDQKNIIENIHEAIKSLNKNKLNNAIHYLSMILKKVGHTFSDDEDISNQAEDIAGID